jgi:hypothetical protein
LACVGRARVGVVAISHVVTTIGYWRVHACVVDASVCGTHVGIVAVAVRVAASLVIVGEKRRCREKN